MSKYILLCLPRAFKKTLSKFKKLLNYISKYIYFNIYIYFDINTQSIYTLFFLKNEANTHTANISNKLFYYIISVVSF